MDADIQSKIKLVTFSNEAELNWISDIMRQELAEPYSLFTYTNFLSTWPELAIMAYHDDKIVGTIIGSYDTVNPKKSYIAMLVVDKEYRRLKVGKKLFDQFYTRVKNYGATKIVLETECINTAALNFYIKLGFFKTRRMLNYYLSGNDAFRLKLYIPENQPKAEGANNNETDTETQK